MTETVITQADRIAWADYEDFEGASRDRALSGAWDATYGLHAFTKHRLAARNEALAEAAKVADANVSDWDYTAENIAASIRALANNQQQEAG